MIEKVWSALLHARKALTFGMTILSLYFMPSKLISLIQWRQTVFGCPLKLRNNQLDKR